MAEMDWARPVPSPATPALPAWVRGLAGRYLDWEDLITLLLTLGATVAVAGTMEGAGWSDHMPALTLVSVLAVIGALIIARSDLHTLLAWPIGVLVGALVVFWQTLEMVRPGTLGQRLDAIYTRFDGWFYLAFHNGVSHDTLPFNVLVLGVTWLGVFLFAWCIFRWHHAWIGLIPGGIALFVDLTFIGDALTGAAIIYVLFGSLLVMRTNLTARMARWRREGIDYPPMLSLTFLNFTSWALLAMIVIAWLAPVGPFSTPAPVEAAVRGVEKLGVNVVRLAGPLHVKKVVPLHSYGGVLPFQGSVKLGDRELMAVKLNNQTLQAPLTLRGAVYDRYSSGGWEEGERQEVSLPEGIEQRTRQQLLNDKIAGTLVPVEITMATKSVVGTVLFTPGQVVSANRPLTVQLPEASAGNWSLPRSAANLPDERILAQLLGKELIPLGIERTDDGRPTVARVFDTSQQAVPDFVALDPGSRVKRGESYKVLGFIPSVTADELRAAGEAYPKWVSEQYLPYPDSVPPRVGELALQTAAAAANPYDKTKRIEDYLRAVYPVDYAVEDTPPDRDTVDYFLFDARRGYFDYHASAMVIMLRTLGVPARLAVGFVVAESDYDKDQGAYVVRDRNSYAWPEVYFPKYGWIAFNPTPDRPADLTPGQRGPDDSLLDAPTLEDFPDLPVSGLERVGLPQFPEGGAGSGGSVSGNDERSYAPWALLAMAGFIVAMSAMVRLGWQRSVRGLPYPHQVWEKTVRLASWAGYPPQPGQTPRDYARGLERAFLGARGFPTLAGVYSRSRYGRGDASAEEREEIDRIWPDLRGRLLGAIFSRVLRRR